MIKPTQKWVGWRYALLIGGLVGSVALFMYPIAVSPYFYPQKWSKYIIFHHRQYLLCKLLCRANMDSQYSAASIFR